MKFLVVQQRPFAPTDVDPFIDAAVIYEYRGKRYPAVITNIHDKHYVDLEITGSDGILNSVKEVPSYRWFQQTPEYLRIECKYYPGNKYNEWYYSWEKIEFYNDSKPLLTVEEIRYIIWWAKFSDFIIWLKSSDSSAHAFVSTAYQSMPPIAYLISLLPDTYSVMPDNKCLVINSPNFSTVMRYPAWVLEYYEVLNNAFGTFIYKNEDAYKYLQLYHKISGKVPVLE